MSRDNIEYLVHHIFLPPKLPQKDDFRVEDELFLLNAITAAFEKFESRAKDYPNNILEALHSTISCLKSVHDGSNGLSAAKLEEAFMQLPAAGQHRKHHISPDC